MSAVQRAEFQHAAVKHVAGRLRDRRGSRRFLLADEVGLGKTIVAAGVIEELARGSRDEPLRVIYLCSNAEIAEQNRTKLDPDAGRPVGRVTELALHRNTDDRNVILYSFTPGTSLHEGTGLAWERRMMLYLLHRIFDIPLGSRSWSRFFQCSARDEERWMRETRARALQDEFQRRTTARFQDELAATWRSLPGAGSLITRLEEAVASFDPTSAASRSERNRWVARLRGAMQRIALRALEPGLIILDEVQRFRDVLDNAKTPDHLAFELFRERRPVLVLSATPYRWLTLDHEAEAIGDSHKEFFEILRFLFGDDAETPQEVQVLLEDFRRRLQLGVFVQARDNELLRIKRRAEELLRQVICRTERNWYLLDVKNGIEEPSQGNWTLPSQAALEELFWIHRGLGPHLESAGQAEDFWKSCPSPLTFLDANYALLRRLRDERTLVPKEIVTPAHDIEALRSRNPRLEHVVKHSLGADPKRPPLLWTTPTYRYSRTDFFGELPPRKLLVFSGWRFVPKAVAVVTSRDAASRLGDDAPDKLQPLRFSDRRAFHVFDACFPSFALAELVNPRAPIGDRVGEDRGAEEVLEAAVQTLRSKLQAARVRVADTGTTPLWRAIARLEARASRPAVCIAALDGLDAGDGDEPSEAVTRHRDELLEWMADAKEELVLDEGRLRRMALIAVASPAVSLLRALRSVYGREATDERDAAAVIVRLCFGALRRYLNRPMVQQVIRETSLHTNWSSGRPHGERRYVERVLLYACEGQLQAVFDEHVYLLRNAAQCARVEQAVDHLDGVLGLSRGSRRTNGRRGNGDMVRIDTDAESHPTHFALAFGDDVSRDVGHDDEDGERMRRSVVREAFNSPFWPFVLATTSVGQEGLDFHLFCRDIHHWNLPSNPVDLEQREGRINRRDCLAVRASIAQDWPLASFKQELGGNSDPNPWALVFDRLEREASAERHRHGLYPHWVYESAKDGATVRIQRHVTFFQGSRDQHKYERLKRGLALYRLVFGQPRQEDLLKDLEAKLGELSGNEQEAVMQRLRGYMLSLSPIGMKEARALAEAEARRLLEKPDQLRELFIDVAKMRATHAAELDAVAEDLDLIVEAAENASSRVAARRMAVAALAYLRNPFDSVFDHHTDGGLDDDIEVIRDAAAELRSRVT